MKIITESIHSDLKWAIKAKLPFQFDRQEHHNQLSIDYLINTQNPVIFVYGFLLNEKAEILLRKVLVIKDDTSTALNYKEFEAFIMNMFRDMLDTYKNFPKLELPKDEPMPEKKQLPPFSIYLNAELKAEMLEEARLLGLKNTAQYLKVLHNLHRAKRVKPFDYNESVRRLEGV